MNLRDLNIKRISEKNFDVLIIGGGINGAVSAASLSARGARVALVEKRDFAGFTSQNSSNLVWGGIKYLETYEFSLVRKLCKSRNLLIRSYPSSIKEIRFFANLEKGFRFNPFSLFCGAIIYWAIGNFFTRPPRLLTKNNIKKIEPVLNVSRSTGGFEYSDAFLFDGDSRFVFNFIRSAIENNCTAINYMESLGSSRNEENLWLTRLRDVVNGEILEVKSDLIINACGPFVDIQNNFSNMVTPHRHVYSKGIHLIVPKITDKKRILTFFADDGRLFFAIPFENRTMIGTTDTRVSKPETKINKDDRSFVLDNINKRLNLKKPLSDNDIISERCGVRPLVIKSDDVENKTDEWTKLSRKHEIDVDFDRKHISIFGGKLTDCLNVGEEICKVVSQLGVNLVESKKKWYGEPSDEVREEFFKKANLKRLDDLTTFGASEYLSKRLWRLYGDRAISLLDKIVDNPKMAEPLIKGSDYLKCELNEAAKNEMIVTLEDFLKRRSKIAIVVPHKELKNSEEIKKVCEILFGDKAENSWQEYFVK